MSDAIDLSMYFMDPDGDMLTYGATSDMMMYATVSLSGSMLTVMGVADGMATITVTATDPDGEMASQTFMVTVATPPMEMGSVDSSSTSGSATVELTLTIENLANNVPVGGAIVLYLEDDYQEPDRSAPARPTSCRGPMRVETGNSARVYATHAPEIDTDDYFTPDKDDIDITVLVPDMCTNATDACEGDNGLMAGDTVTLVLTKAAGIKNPSEAGSHSTAYSVMDAVGNELTEFTATDVKTTVAKIGLSDVDNDRGYELTVTGSGFNNGTSAAVHVLGHAPTTRASLPPSRRRGTPWTAR